MSIRLTTYVCPYYTAPRDFAWYEWDHVICDGRMEAGHDDERLILIPNRKLPGIDREMTVDPLGEQELVQINLAMIVREKAAFARMTADLIDYCEDNNIEISETWGVVPCWS